MLAEYKQGSSRYKKITKTIVSAFMTRAVSVIVQLSMIPLAVDYLGKAQYGLLVAIMSIIGMLSFADGGIANAVVNMVAHSSVKGKNAITSVVSTAFICVVAFSLVGFSVFFLLSEIVNWGLLLGLAATESDQVVKQLLLIIAASYFLTTIVGFAGKVQRGYQEGYIENNWNSAGIIIGLISVLIAIYCNLGMVGFTISFSIGPIISGAVNSYIYFKYKKPSILPRIRYFDPHLIRRLWSVGGMFFILQITAAIQLQADNLIISNISGVEAVTDYSICMKLFVSISGIIAIILSPLWPAYREALSSGDGEWVKVTFYKSMKWTLIASVPVAILMVLFGQEIISIWVPNSGIPSIRLLIGCAVWMLLMNIGHSISVFFNAKEIIKFQCFAAAISGALNIILTIYLVKTIGPDGAVYGSVIAYFFCAILPSYYYIKKLKPI